MTGSTMTADTTSDPLPGGDEDERRRLIATAVEDLRPMLRNDGGDMELVEISGDIVRIGLRGACVGCGLAGQTLGMVRRRLVEVLGTHVRVLPAPWS